MESDVIYNGFKVDILSRIPLSSIIHTKNLAFFYQRPFFCSKYNGGDRLFGIWQLSISVLRSFLQVHTEKFFVHMEQFFTSGKNSTEQKKGVKLGQFLILFRWYSKEKYLTEKHQIKDFVRSNHEDIFFLRGHERISIVAPLY